MAEGTKKGDYDYEQISGGESYTLSGYLSNGTFVVP